MLPLNLMAVASVSSVLALYHLNRL
jgi:hypothetical protein